MAMQWLALTVCWALLLAPPCSLGKASKHGMEDEPPREPPASLEITMPDAKEAVEWLQHFYSSTDRLAWHYPGMQPQAQAPSWGQALRSLTRTCGVAWGGLQRHGRALLVAPVGDSWSAAKWLDRPRSAAFDVIALYYGQNQSFACELCSDVFHMRGPKWHLYFNLTSSPQWEAILARGYTYIMFPDDDLEMNTCQINTFLSLMHEFDALMGQPSVCKLRDSSYTYWPLLYQRKRYMLRFTTFLEIMAPAFRMDFYHSVIRATLNGTYTGYGLDLVWPALLRYPLDKIAVVDEVCMVHPPSPPGGKPGGLYDITLGPFRNQGSEMSWILHHYNYRPEVVQRLGVVDRAMLNLSLVKAVSWRRVLKQAGASLFALLAAAALGWRPLRAAYGRRGGRPRTPAKAGLHHRR